MMLCYYPEFHYAECPILFDIVLNVVMPSVIMLNVVMLSVVMLSVVMLNVIILNGIMLSVIMLSVIMLIVVAPVFQGLSVEEKKSFNDIETSSFVLGSIIQGLKRN